MYINFGFMDVRATKASFEVNGAYVVTFPVESKTEGSIGEIHFISDKDGNGSIEWCRGRMAQGYGKRISMEELISLLEQRESGSGE